MACETCKGKEAKTPETIPYMAHEFAMVRMERQVKRLWIALIVCICLIFASNAAWLVYESQYETLEYSCDYQQDGQGTNIIGNGNDVNNGAKTESESQGQK